ncbi:hypothetical protein BU17DRAFT_67113 [Hysterangium stoloniferum]|nr:hypothetical protein BU17DRAFT_67113 [Hysterangium stoloniferum]
MQNPVSNIVQNLPFDILDHIVTFIVNPQDLLYFALTCQRFASFVVPHHLRQGRISCIIAKIRSFELIWEGKESPAPIIPCSLGDFMHHDKAFDEEIATSLATDDIIELNVNMISSIIQGMSLLFRFRWQTEVEPPERLSARLFTSLGSSCQHLKEMVLSSTTTNASKAELRTSYYDLGPVNHWQPTCRLSKLTRFILRAVDPGQATINTIVNSLINHCPTLSDISIILPFFIQKRSPRYRVVIPRVYAPGFFRDGNWPDLKRLALFGPTLSFHGSTIIDPYEDDAIIRFWKRHSKLKLLILDCDTLIPPFMVAPGQTSSLKCLFISFSAVETFGLALEVAQNLTCFQLSGTVYDYDFIVSLLMTMSSLRSLTLEHWPEDDLTSLVSAIPRVRRLRLRNQFLHWREDRENSLHKFSPLIHLTHLGGLWKSPPRSARCIPPNKSLRYISVVNALNDTDEETWLKLQRNERGDVIGFSYAGVWSQPLSSDEDQFFLRHLPDQCQQFM